MSQDPSLNSPSQLKKKTTPKTPQELVATPVMIEVAKMLPILLIVILQEIKVEATRMQVVTTVSKVVTIEAGAAAKVDTSSCHRLMKKLTQLVVMLKTALSESIRIQGAVVLTIMEGVIIQIQLERESQSTKRTLTSIQMQTTV